MADAVNRTPQIGPRHTCGGVLSADDPSVAVPMPIGGRVADVDRCIAHLVAALNAGGVRTIASCCGHDRYPGSVALDDGRVLLILPDKATFARAWEALDGIR